MRETHTFPTEEELFQRFPYAERSKEISQNAIAEMGRINGRAAALCLGSFIIIFLIGFGGAAIVDRAGENWKNVNLAYQEIEHGQ